MTKSSQKVSKLYTIFENYTLKCKENVYLEYMINHQPAATWLMIDIKQPELYLFDIKHQQNTLLVDA